MKLNLKGYQGNVKKTATVFSNDPQKSRAVLTLQGTVKALIELSPTRAITFRGLASQLQDQTITVSATTHPFSIENVTTNLEGKINYQLKTVEEGKQYTLTVSNRLNQGNYGGFIKLSTNLSQKPLIVVRVIGYVEGELAVRPQTILVGKLLSQQTLRLGKVMVVSNHDKPFKITDLRFDSQLIDVSRQPLPNSQGYALEITPKLENVPEGTRHQTTLMIETDLTPGEQYEVHVHVLNSGNRRLRPTPGESREEGDTEGDLDDELEEENGAAPEDR